MKRTPRERASRLWRFALLALLVGAITGGASGLFTGVGVALGVIAPVFFVTAVLLGAIAINLTTRRPELVWIVAGILIFWVCNSAIYLNLVTVANTTLNDVPSQAVIDLLSTLFVAGTGALIAAALLTAIGWLVRPGRWLSMNGPSGQS